MSKILDASCDASGKVTVEGQVISPVTILSLGKQASTGVLIIEEDKLFYVASSATDIKTTIDKLSSIADDIANALSTIATTLTSIGAGMTGSSTAPPPTLGANVTTINSKSTDIAQIKTDLDTLKVALK